MILKILLKEPVTSGFQGGKLVDRMGNYLLVKGELALIDLEKAARADCLSFVTSDGFSVLVPKVNIAYIMEVPESSR